jgi:hypothetical protein
MMTNQVKNNKEITTGLSLKVFVLLLIVFVVILWNYFIEQSKREVKNEKVGTLLKQNDSLRLIILQNKEEVEDKKRRVEETNVEYHKTITNYEKEKTFISLSDDSAQYSIFQNLLSRNKRQPLERD